jgi:hypothetical protein
MVGTKWPNVSYAQGFGATLVVGSLFIQSWRRTLAAVRHDAERKRAFQGLSRRLFRNLLVASVAIAAVVAIFRLFASSGDGRIFLASIPLLVLLALVFDTGATALNIHRMR